MGRKAKSKTCITCGEKKPINRADHEQDGFGYHTLTKDGYRKRCTACFSKLLKRSPHKRTADLVREANDALDAPPQLETKIIAFFDKLADSDLAGVERIVIDLREPRSVAVTRTTTITTEIAS